MDDARSRYLADAVATASPARLLTMLYDRLLLDLTRAQGALDDGDRAAATASVGHAEEVVAELMGALDDGGWDGSGPLMSIYSFVLSQLVRVGATGDGSPLAACRELLEPLATAWHDAADEVGRQALPAQRGDQVPSGLLGVG